MSKLDTNEIEKLNELLTKLLQRNLEKNSKIKLADVNLKDLIIVVNSQTAQGGVAGIDVNGQILPNLADPQSDQDAATKKYVDDNSGSGDVTGPSSSVDNGIAIFDGTTGKIIKNSTGPLLSTGGKIVNVTAGTDPNDVAIISQLPSGVGDVSGPSSSTADGIAIFDGTTGKLIKNTTGPTIASDGRIENGTAGTNPTDFATVNQLGGGSAPSISYLSATSNDTCNGPPIISYTSDYRPILENLANYSIDLIQDFTFQNESYGDRQFPSLPLDVYNITSVSNGLLGQAVLECDRDATAPANRGLIYVTGTTLYDGIQTVLAQVNLNGLTIDQPFAGNATGQLDGASGGYPVATYTGSSFKLLSIESSAYFNGVSLTTIFEIGSLFLNTMTNSPVWANLSGSGYQDQLQTSFSRRIYGKGFFPAVTGSKFLTGYTKLDGSFDPSGGIQFHRLKIYGVS